MVTSRHWPEAAAFLEHIHHAIPTFTSDAPNDTSWARILVTQTPLHGMTCEAYVVGDAPFSYHQTLAQAAFRRTLSTEGFSFLAPPPRLHALTTHGLDPLLSVIVHPEHADVHPSTLRLAHRSSNGRGGLHGHPSTFFTLDALPQAFQMFLDTVDTLEDHQPSIGAPWWEVLNAHGIISAPFQANTEHDARILAPVFAWTIIEDDPVIVRPSTAP